ncbi:hypothetical protein [Emticicia sp. BO119]|uniref:hypothetical protein n=1 Tax=Emticicia sp. BO119 TaxID=2757768 RepID=UPI0015F0C440|nr:hypothetical protein [Emticicia sp. BO119]MBA4853121.1 hypothetical protein [Emticicia sp. BO119]
MKKVLIFFFLSLSIRSCSDEITQSEFLQFHSKLYGSGFKPQPINLANNANTTKFFYALKAQRAHYDELLEEMDILFPLENFPEEERIEADRKYRSFVQSHPNEVFLPIIRSRYSKFMLVNFRLLETENYEQIKYYTNELIEAKSDRHELLIKCLKKLKGNINVNEFNQLQRHTVDILKEQQETETTQLIILRNKIEELAVRYRETEEKPTRSFVDELERQIRKLEENTIACIIEEVETI